MVTAEIITIGDELLIGQVINTNSSFLARELNKLGIRVERVTSVADNSTAIKTILNEASLRADLILATGGLGPTSDDITKPAIADYFGTRLTLFAEVLEHVKELLSKRGIIISDANASQAMLPESCEVLRNDAGTAPGMWFRKNDKVYAFLPGVPFEMEQIFTEQLKDKLAVAFNLEVLIHETILTFGLAESIISMKLEKWEKTLPPEVKLAYLPSPGIVRLRISGVGGDREKLQKIVDIKKSELHEILGSYIFGYNNDKPEELAGRLLTEKSLTLSTAESCTGGTIGSMITSVPGSSAYYKGGIISYSNELKISGLGVPEELIIKHGAVSSETAIAMAEGARKAFKSDVSIAVTGIAGPTGGNTSKPVGTTWIALSSPRGNTASKYLFGEHRGRNIQKASVTAIVMLKKMLEEY